MNSDMVKPEKFVHLHLVYHFTVRLMTSSYHSSCTTSFKYFELSWGNDNKQAKDCSLAYFKPIFYFLTWEHKRQFSELSTTFGYNALKIDTYTHIWPMFHFPSLKLQKPYSFLKLSVNVKKCNIVLNWG